MAIETQQTKTYFSSSTAVSTSTTAAVGGVMSISGPSGSAGEIDVTTFDSTAKEYIIGLRDEGTITLEMVRDVADPGQNALISAFKTRVKRKLVIDFSTLVIEASAVGARLTADAYVSGFSYSLGTDDAVKASATLRLTGAMETTKATS